MPTLFPLIVPGYVVPAATQHLSALQDALLRPVSKEGEKGSRHGRVFESGGRFTDHIASPAVLLKTAAFCVLY